MSRVLVAFVWCWALRGNINKINDTERNGNAERRCSLVPMRPFVEQQAIDLLVLPSTNSPLFPINFDHLINAFVSTAEIKKW